MTQPRLADSLVTLRNEVDARYPMRNKDSDGWIGNEAHQATASDHNPNADGVVCAIDLTNDPASGADMAVIAERLRNLRHPDVKYVIRHWDRQMFSAYEAHGVPPFTWRDYSGAAARELHVSVGRGRDGQSVEPYDDTTSWFAPVDAPTPPQTSQPNDPPFFWTVRHPMLRGSSIGWAQRVLIDGCEQDLGATGADGIYGPLTAAGIGNLQRQFSIADDEIVGPQTWPCIEYVAAVHGIT